MDVDTTTSDIRCETTPLIAASHLNNNNGHLQSPCRKHPPFLFNLIAATSLLFLSFFFFFSSSTTTSKWRRRTNTATLNKRPDIVPSLQSSSDLFYHHAAVSSATSGRHYNTKTTTTGAPSGMASRTTTTAIMNGSLEVLCVGDWGREGILPQKMVAASLARTATAGTTIISSGDNFYNHGVKAVSDKRWFKSYEDVYGRLPELHGLEFLPVLGNHDHLGDPLAQVLYSDVSPTWKLPARYSAQHIIGNVLLVRLDTTPYARDKSGRKARRAGFAPDPQTIWFEHTLKLAAQHNTYVLVIGHHNMYTGSTCGHKGTRHLRHALEHLLIKYRRNILAYVCGHEHALMHLRKHGIDHIVSGGGSLLDPICRPNNNKYNKKKYKRNGVLVNAEEGAKFVKSSNGFFKLEFHPEKRTFAASAINEKQEVIYSFEKIVAPLG